MSKRPAISINGFYNDWEQRKIGEVASFSKGSGYSKADIRDSGVPLILYGRLYTKYETIIHKVDTYAIPKEGSVYSRGDEVIIPASGETAEDISIASVVDKAGFLLGGDLNVVTPNNDIDPTFLALSISHGKTHCALSKLAQGKSVVHIHNSDIQSVDLRYPKKDEQKQISRYFIQLDSIITLHQSKYDKLLMYKKAMLKKMFPKDGSGVPEVRFTGFSSTWQLRTVGSLIEDYIEKTTVENQYPVLTSSQQLGILLQEDYFADRQVTTENNIGYYVLPRGYFSYRSRSDTNLFVFNRNDVIDKGIISYYYPVFRAKDCDSDFLLVRLNYRMESQIAMAAEGTGQKVLAHSKFKKMCMYVPELEEQIKIGSFFSKLEKRIICQREYLVRLNAIKKSLLDKMFI